MVALPLYLILLKRELHQLKEKITTLSQRQVYGGRLSLEFREKNLLEMVDAINSWTDEMEQKGQGYQELEENIKLTIAGLSHDLRTPLTAINGYVQLLSLTEDREKRAQYITIIEQSVDRLLSMTNQFYDLTRIETKQKEMELQSVSFADEVEEVFFSFYEQFREQRVEVKFVTRISGTVLADRIMLTRVLQNIVQNLLRYGQDQSEISFSEAEDTITLRVANQVKSGAKVSLDKVFQRFYTENTSRSNTESSGLGLYLSKKLVEGMGGTMSAELSQGEFAVLVTLQKVR